MKKKKDHQGVNEGNTEEVIEAGTEVHTGEMEEAIATLAEAQEQLNNDVQEIKKKVSSISVVATAAHVPVALPVYSIEGQNLRFKFPSVLIGGRKVTAQDLESDEALRLSLYNEKPNLFVKA